MILLLLMLAGPHPRSLSLGVSRTRASLGPQALLALAVFCGAAQQQTGASRTALATVADPRNQPIVDLGPDDFVIKEGADARDILSVHIADYPVVVLVDTGGAARADFEIIRKAVARFVDRLGRRPVSVGTLGDPPALVTAFDDDRKRVAERLGALRAESPADSLALQAAAMAAQKLRDTGSPFSAIVVVSASAIDASRSGPEEMIGPIIDSGAIIHVVANRPVGSVEAGRLPQMLRGLTQQTQGQFTAIYSAASYQSALDHLADRMATELMIEYLVPAGSSASDVKVGVRIPGARVRGLGVRPRQ